jgi:hypothetical protein
VVRRHEQIRLQNVRIFVAARRHHFDNQVGVPFLCECDDELCHEFVVVTLPDYERVRHERLILAAAGHPVQGASLFSQEDGYQVYRFEPSAVAVG